MLSVSDDIYFSNFGNVMVKCFHFYINVQKLFFFLSLFASLPPWPALPAKEHGLSLITRTYKLKLHQIIITIYQLQRSYYTLIMTSYLSCLMEIVADVRIAALTFCKSVSQSVCYNCNRCMSKLKWSHTRCGKETALIFLYTSSKRKSWGVHFKFRNTSPTTLQLFINIIIIWSRLSKYGWILSVMK